MKTKEKQQEMIFKKGDKIRFNIDVLEKEGWIGLTPNGNIHRRDYRAFLYENEERIFVVAGSSDIMGQFRIDDEYLQHTSFNPEELILVERKSYTKDLLTTIKKHLPAFNWIKSKQKRTLI